MAFFSSNTSRLRPRTSSALSRSSSETAMVLGHIVPWTFARTRPSRPRSTPLRSLPWCPVRPRRSEARESITAPRADLSVLRMCAWGRRGRTAPRTCRRPPPVTACWLLMVRPSPRRPRDTFSGPRGLPAPPRVTPAAPAEHRHDEQHDHNRCEVHVFHLPPGRSRSGAGITDYASLRPDRWAASPPEHMRTYRADERRDRAADQHRRRSANGIPANAPSHASRLWFWYALTGRLIGQSGHRLVRAQKEVIFTDLADQAGSVKLVQYRTFYVRPDETQRRRRVVAR